MTDAPSPTLTLIGFAPTRPDVDLAIAGLTQAAAAQNLPTKAFLYAVEKAATPSSIKSRALAGLEPEALVRLHNSGLAGDRAHRLAYFRSGFMALALKHALTNGPDGTVAAWPAAPAAFLGGRLEAPTGGDELWRTGSTQGWRVLRIDDPARLTTTLTRAADAYLDGTAWRLADRDLDHVLAATLAAATLETTLA